MEKLFENGHAVELPENDFSGNLGKTWYQAHFDVNTSGKFRVVFDCAARFKNLNLNDYLLHSPKIGNSLMGVLPDFVYTFMLWFQILKRCIINV